MPFDALSKLTITRRRALAAAALVAAGFKTSFVAAATNLSLLCPRSPDPTPPGYGGYAEPQTDKWQAQHGAFINYRAVAWKQVHDKIAAGFDGRAALHDVNYTAGWIPEFSVNLASLEDKLLPSVLADLPKSSDHAVTWNGVRYGAPLSLSILTLHFNETHFQEAGISSPPKTWDELQRVAAQLTTDKHAGWVIISARPRASAGPPRTGWRFCSKPGARSTARTAKPPARPTKASKPCNA